MYNHGGEIVSVIPNYIDRAFHSHLSTCCRGTRHVELEQPQAKARPWQVCFSCFLFKTLWSVPNTHYRLNPGPMAFPPKQTGRREKSGRQRKGTVICLYLKIRSWIPTDHLNPFFSSGFIFRNNME